MYFIKEMSHTIQLYPTTFGPRVTDLLKTRLRMEIEGSCTGRYGYVVAVLEILDATQGTIIPGAGLAEFDVKYKAVVCKPLKGEVVEGVVGTVNKMGFHVDVGPLNVFVSTHLIPSDLKFDPNAESPQYASEDQVIQKGAMIRLKIINARMDSTEIFGIGSIKDDYLGVVGN
ncbi:MAG: DNA-directed RNA polymerase II subunit rpb7 [Piptocephalis tieghemiana]|nr:MAG: DNA-directed RNA polymerase II subunit rpb7 [Piptocephalis tieghemiana]